MHFQNERKRFGNRNGGVHGLSERGRVGHQAQGGLGAPQWGSKSSMEAVHQPQEHGSEAHPEAHHGAHDQWQGG